VLAQSSDTLSISFVPMFQNRLLSIQEEEQFIRQSDAQKTDSDSIEIKKFLCYISQIELYNGEELVFSEENSFHLLDATDTNSLFLKMKTPKDLIFTELKFSVGIDSLTNVSGAMGYQQPFYPIQKVVLPIDNLKDNPIAKKKAIKIKILLDELLSEINLSKTYQIMSPNEEFVFNPKYRFPKEILLQSND